MAAWCHGQLDIDALTFLEALAVDQTPELGGFKAVASFVGVEEADMAAYLG